ncbi:MAG: lamin tail domain-containing protein, partial [Chitinivibrionales bacterium]|nr:lamin tail domain-containing protein [Chitinivibrionales bacterium]
IYKWTVPQVRSTSCVLRFKDMADSVKYQTGRFSILFGTAIVANPGSVEASIAKNNSKDIDVVVQNAGNGVVSFKAESKYLSQMVLINEFYMGSIQKFPMNGVELYNRGPEVDLSNWKLHWVDNAGTSMTYTFPSGSKIRAGSTVVATKENSSPNDSTFFIGQSVFWRSGTLKLAIVLKNSANIAVDYVQIGGDTTIAGLKGISWNGVNVPINAGFFKKDLAFVMRKGTVNHFSAEDWVMDTVGGTINALNAGQKNSMNPKPWLTLEQSSGVLDSFLMKKVTLHYMTKELGLGILRDTIYISHNAAAQPSPLVVPCRIEIVPVTANSKKTDKNSSFFIVGPENPLSKRGFSTLTFTFSDKECKAVRLSIFDALGNCIKSVPMNGSYTWDLKNLHGKTVGSGVYEAVLSVTYKDGTSTMFEKMIGIKE